VIFDWDKGGFQSFLSDPEVPPIIKAAGHRTEPVSAKLGGKYYAYLGVGWRTPRHRGVRKPVSQRDHPRSDVSTWASGPCPRTGSWSALGRGGRVTSQPVAASSPDLGVRRVAIRGVETIVALLGVLGRAQRETVEPQRRARPEAVACRREHLLD
jgi:hypothetical protein